MRSNGWLREQLNFLLKTYFSDVPITNPIEIKFGREAKYRFGSIRLYPNSLPRRQAGKLKIPNPKFLFKKVPQRSIIMITSLFAKENVPVGVVRYTISHELCHYAHGFSSSNKRLFRHPHHGGVVNKELTRRGAEHLTATFKKWLKGYRADILKSRIKL